MADELGVPLADVQVLHGDTEMLPSGQGTFASRGLSVGGTAMYVGVQEARRKMARIAARFLRYAAVHDCGHVINPRLLEGQAQGAIRGRAPEAISQPGHPARLFGVKFTRHG